MRRLLASAAVQRLAARVLALYLDLALRTTRWSLHGEHHVQAHVAGAPCVVAFWHERLPLMPVLWRLARERGVRVRAHVLVSRHRDGRFIGEVVRRFGLDIVHGSTARPGRTKGGANGARTLMAMLQGGDHVAITPDGPRGPRRQAAPGVAQIAAIAGVPVVPAAAQTTRRRVLGSWDRMVLPLPFGRGVVVCGAPIPVPREDWQSALPAIEAALTEAAEQADLLCAA